MSVQKYVQERGHIHLLWTIFILVLVISGLLIKSPNGGTISDYISFAASIASLILAIVAIFYSIVSNQTFFESVGTLHTISKSIQNNSDIINCTIDEFNKKTDGLIVRISDVPQSVEKLADGLNTRLDALSITTASEKTPDKGNTSKYPFLDRASTGTLLGLYLLGQSFEKTIPFQLSKMFSDKTLGSYMNGLINAFRSTAFQGLKIEYSENTYTVLDTGSIKFTEFNENIRKSKNKLTVETIKIIDSYFSNEQSGKKVIDTANKATK